MVNTFLIATLGVIATLLLVLSIAWMVYSRRFVSANLTASLTVYLMRSCLVKYTRDLGGAAVNDNKDALAWIDGSQVAVLAWVLVSGAIFVFVKMVVPFIHEHFIIVRTPPGVPDKVVQINNDRERRRA